MVVPTIGIRIRFFFASSTPLRMDSGTSPALPSPTPTWPWPSPTTTTALKLNRRPPLTTLATRLTRTTFSSSARLVASIFGIRTPAYELRHPRGRRSTAWLPGHCSEIEAALARRVRELLHATMIEVPTAIEHNLGDPRRLSALGDHLADRLGARALRARSAAHARLDRRS